MIGRHCYAVMLLIVVYSLMRVALVIGSELNINFNHTTATIGPTVYNQYATRAQNFRKLPSARLENLDLSKRLVSHNRDNFQAESHSSQSIIQIDESGVSDKESVIDKGTNSSTTKPLSTEILSDYNNGLKIEHHGNTKDSLQRLKLLAVKRRRQLSSPITSAQKIVEDYRYIEDKDTSDPRIIPIYLPDIEYENRDGEEFYEEMDELLKLKRKLTGSELLESNKQKQRGDMNPLLSSPRIVNHQEEIPTRGDVGTRSKRSHHHDELWGFAEDEGYVSSDEVKTSNINRVSNDYSSNELSRDADENQSMELQSEREKKLLDYIARNRPVIVPYRRANDNQRDYRPMISSEHGESRYGTDDGKDHYLMQRKQSAISMRKYDGPRKLTNEEFRINNLPISARIIITRGPFSPADSSIPSTRTPPPFLSRGNFDDDIMFPVISPDNSGLVVKNFPSPRTESPLKTSPSACVWAIVQCCPSNVDIRRLTKCFEYMGCPGVNWDPNPCRRTIMEWARTEVLNYYASSMKK